MNILKKYFLVFSLVLSVATGARAVSVVKARLDSATLLMGKVTTLRLSVEQDQGTTGHFPIFKNIMEKGYVGVCGDSVEFRAPVKVDTVVTGKRLNIEYEIPVQSFDSGMYKLPMIEFVTGVDTARSNSLELKVYPVPNVTAETPIADYANVAEPENKSIFDSLPDWMVHYWWVLLIILVILTAAWAAWKKYRKDGHILPKKPEPTPYEEASSALKLLKEKKLWENGMEKEYFTELTDILRRYLYRRFGINAMEMTSRQILASLSGNKDTKEQRPMIRQILNMADFVKFAKVRPLPADNIASYDNAVKFVEETRPVEIAEDKGDNPSANIDEKKGGDK